jgi:hypothetical protein
MASGRCSPRKALVPIAAMLASVGTSGCLEAEMAFEHVSAVRLDDDRVRVDMTLRNVGDDDARRACAKVTWRDAQGIIDTGLVCAEHRLNGGSLWYGDVTVICPEDICPEKESMKVDSHWKIPREGVTIEVRVTRSGDMDSMDDYDLVHTFSSP